MNTRALYSIIFIFITFSSFKGVCQSYEVKSILFEGNKVTKPHILRAELDFKEGGNLDISDLKNIIDRNAVRLFNLQLFLWVKGNYIIENNAITITFTMQERWYVWPIPIFSLADRNINAWIQKMDLNRIDYGVHTVWYNFRGRNEQLKSNIQHGFNRKYELFYIVPQINKKQNLGLNFGASYYQSHYIDYINDENIPLTLRMDEAFPLKRKYFNFGLINRNTVENINQFNIKLTDQFISDSVLILNPDFQLTGNRKTYVETELRKTINKRKTFSYPTDGLYMDASLKHKYFFGKGESQSLKLNVAVSKYIKTSNKTFYSIGFVGQTGIYKNLSMSENIALGYKQNIRGFDFYVIDGQHFGIFKQNFNFSLLKNKSLKTNLISSPKFNTMPIDIYVAAHSDFGYVSDDKYRFQNPLANKFLYSGGCGLHFITYYDRVFIIEYTYNSLKEFGLFVSTKFSF